ARLAREGGHDVAIPSLALEAVQQPVEPRDHLDELLERRARQRRRALPAQREVLGTELDQVVLERGLVLQILLCAAALQAVERRLRDEQMPALDDLLEVPVEEREQERPDVRAVDVGVAHEDDRVVAQLLYVLVLAADAGAERGDQELDLL